MHWSPFLRAAYVEAGFDDEKNPRVELQNRQGPKKTPCCFHVV
jgi:hypothetical protein